MLRNIWSETQFKRFAILSEKKTVTCSASPETLVPFPNWQGFKLSFARVSEVMGVVMCMLDTAFYVDVCRSHNCFHWIESDIQDVIMLCIIQ